MPENISGNLADPTCRVDVTEQGSVRQQDNDVGQHARGPQAQADPGTFPATAPGLEDQQKAAAKRAATSPNGGDPTGQTYNATVPYSGSSLALGTAASAGGSGASLTTGGNIFMGATGKTNWQCVGAFTGQTNATMGLFSTGGTAAHSQNKFEIYAGGGVAPGPCGAGGPAGNGGVTKPAETAERITNGIANAMGVVKGANDIRNTVAGWSGSLSDKLALAKGIADVGNKGTALGMGIAGAGKDTTKAAGQVGDTTSGVLNILGGLAKIKEDPAAAASSVLAGASSISGAFGGVAHAFGSEEDGPVKGSDGAASKVPGAHGGGGGGGGGGGHGGGGSLDIEKRAAASIHQACNVKITGNAPEGIDWKVGGAYLVNAIASVEFSTTNWGAFAAYQFKVRAGAKIEVKCRKFEMKALATGTVITAVTKVEASTMSELDGITKVSQTLTVEAHTHLHDILHVKKNSLLEGNLDVQKDGEEKKDLKVHKICKFGADLKVGGKFVAKNKLYASDEAKFG